MTRSVRTLTSESGVAMVQLAVFLPMLVLFTGLAVDTGRAYVVRRSSRRRWTARR